jgi:molybdate transport system permease protein
VVRALAIALGLALVLLLGLPLVSLVLRVSPGELLDRVRQPLILEALRLSLVTSLAATFIVVALGLPVAYALNLADFRGKRALEVLIDLPMVLPPTVAGVALLTAFGRTGLAGQALAVLGVSLPFTTLGVIVAQAFVAAPFFVGAARAGFAEVDRKYLDAAATLRATPATAFLRVLVPLAGPSLLAGAAMSWARALGEFGATITFAGNMPGVTQTMPLAVYLALQSDVEAAIVLSVLLLAVSLTVLLCIRLVPSRLAGLPVRARRAPR